MEIFLCTGNAGKVNEILPLLPRRFKVRSLLDEVTGIELSETGGTLEANAWQKALWGLQHSGSPSIADDSGLEVNTLRGEPGVRSANYAGAHRSDEANMALLLERLKEASDRSARFRTVIALAGPNGVSLFEGIVNGTIATEKRGQNGFGYDPIFIPDGSDRTFGEMELNEKQLISHRTLAVKALIEHLETIIR